MLLWKDFEQKANIHISWGTPNMESPKERLNLLFSTQAKFITGKASLDTDCDSYVQELDKIGIKKAEQILTDSINKK